MKKTLCLILILILTLPIFSIAETNNELQNIISSMPYEDLIKLNQMINEQLFTKGALTSGAKVPPGIYYIGTDIPAGTYRIEFYPATEFDSVTLIANNNDTHLNFIDYLGYGSSNEIGKLELTEGTKLTLTGGTVYFFTYTGIFH